MDLSNFFGGLRTFSPAEAESKAQHKLECLRLAWQRLGDEGGFADFEAFLDALPPALFSTWFGTEGLDRHYTVLLAVLTAGWSDSDVVLVSVLNYILMQLTYQGRYLARSWPETFVLGLGNHYEGVMASANAERCANFAIGPDTLENDQLEGRLSSLAIGHGPFTFGSAEAVAAATPLPPGRTIGCLAFTDLGLRSGAQAIVQESVAALASVITAETFCVFAGEPDVVTRLADHIGKAHPQASLLHRMYRKAKSGAYVVRSVLVVTGVVGGPSLPDSFISANERYVRSVGDWAAVDAAIGTKLVQTHAEEQVSLKRPAVVSSGAPLSDEQLGTISNTLRIGHYAAIVNDGLLIHSEDAFHATYVVAAGERHVVGSTGEPLHTTEREILEPLMDLGTFAHSALARGEKTVEAPRRPKAYVSGPCIPLSFSPVILNYHSHFLLQCFPRIVVAETLGPKDYKLLVSAHLKKYQREMLRMAGLRDEQIVMLDPAYDYACETLYLPAIIPAIYTPLYASVYDRLINQVDLAGIRPHRRILISRSARTTWRNMVNYDTICDLLIRDCGFELVAPEKLTIEDEIRLFRESSIVVGAEGAGLYNCVFMGPGTDVVALADQDYVMYVLGSIAKIRDFDCSFVFGESFQADRDLTRRAGHADFIVDPWRVKACVEELIERKRNTRA